MDFTTDRLGLNTHKMFNTLREDLMALLGVQGILACKDDILFVWDANKNCLLTLALKPFFRSANRDSSNYQILRPSSVPFEDVNNIVISERCQQIALVSDTTICVIDLPKRWGFDAEFEGGKPTVTCRSRMLASSGLHETVLQARWHPDSPSDCHLVVLFSDNMLRVFETLYGSIVEIVLLGNTTQRKRAFSTQGDVGVDFDFAQPTVRKTKKKKSGYTEEVVWPILVLRGNGDVFYVIISLTTESVKCHVVHGPLQMFPSADDNYGGDASCIMILRTTPPVVVISSCNGTLYHALLIEMYNVNEENDENMWPSSNISIEYRIALHFFEAIELELGLSIQGEKTESGAYSCPLRLMKDMYFFARYVCTHDTGVHVITMPIVLQLESYMKSKSDDLDMYIQSFSQHISSAEYLLCTRLNDTTVFPPIGVCVVPSPDTLVVLLRNGEVLSLHLPYIRLPVDDIELNKSTEGAAPKERFDDYIKNILKPPDARVIPVFKLLGRSSPPPQTVFQIMSQASIYFRNEVFPRHQAAAAEIEKRVRTLQLQKQFQLAEIAMLMEDKLELKRKAEQLAEKYEEINDKQQELMKRGECLLLKARSQSDNMSKAEVKMAEDLKIYKLGVEEVRKTLERVQSKINAHKLYASHVKTTQHKKQLALSDRQARIIRDVLKQMAADLLQLKNRVKHVKSVLQRQ